MAAGAVIVAAVLGGALYLMRVSWRPAAPATTGPPRTAIAVLPPQNLSADGPHAYLAGGLHDELLTQLAKVASLKVISRTSVMGYQGTTKPLKQIAGELSVGSIVEGSVQVVDGRLRVNVQLIDAATDQHLWADRYDRTLDDAFAIQSDLAQKIVPAVGATLSREERDRIAAAPTASPEAYQLYLQGRAYFLRAGYLRQNYEMAQRLLERALALDSTFALARVALSQVHGQMYWFRHDPAPTRVASQRAEAEEALRLAPDLPEAHVAMGAAHYFGRRDWRAALDEYSVALQGLPNDVQLREQIGYVHRRMGHWEEVFAAFEQTTRLDPRNASLFSDLGGHTLHFVRKYAEAVRAYDQALSLAPDLHGAAVRRGWAFVRWQGHLGPLRECLDGLPQDADLSALGKAAALYTAWAWRLRGDRDAAKAAFEAARARLDSALRELPDDWRIHAARGPALAGLGRRDDARVQARWLRESAVYRDDALQGAVLAENLAQILAQAGFAVEALDEIERLLAGPSLLSVHTLRLDPRWDPIRNHPRFKALLEKYGSRRRGGGRWVRRSCE